MSIREEELRAVAAGGDETDIAVLADYYEQNGQPSRAAMWRDPARRHLALKSTGFVPLPSPGAGSDYLADYLVRVDRAKRSLQIPPDFIITPQGPTDPRRNAMIWLLMQPTRVVRTNPFTHVSRNVISVEMIASLATCFNLSTSMIRHVITNQDRLIREIADAERKTPTMKATHRLIAAGAILERESSRWVSYPTNQTQMTHVETSWQASAVGTTEQQIGSAIDETSMQIEIANLPDFDAGLYLSSLELPPDTWPYTGTVGLMGPNQIKIGLMRQKPLNHPHPNLDVSDLPLFERHGDRKDTTPRGPRLPRPAKKRP